MGTKAFRNVRLLFAIAVLSFVSPAVAAAQRTGIGVSVQGAIGSHFGDGGDTQSIALGVWFGERFGVVVNAERSHVPTDVTFYEDGYAATRGATTRFVSGEFRYVPVTYKRVSPYVLVVVGFGVSRPNVNEFFPDRVEHNVTLLGPGFGGSVLLDRTPECVRGHPVHVPEPGAASRTPAGSGPSAAASPGDSDRRARVTASSPSIAPHRRFRSQDSPETTPDPPPGRREERAR